MRDLDALDRALADVEPDPGMLAAVLAMRDDPSWTKPTRMMRTCGCVWLAGAREPAYAPGQGATSTGTIYLPASGPA